MSPLDVLTLLGLLFAGVALYFYVIYRNPHRNGVCKCCTHEE